jgi:hypothetical protein
LNVASVEPLALNGEHLADVEPVLLAVEGDLADGQVFCGEDGNLDAVARGSRWYAYAMAPPNA